MKIAKYNNIQDFPGISLENAAIGDLNLFNSLDWFALLQKHIIAKNQQVIYYCVLNNDGAVEAIFPVIKTPAGSGYSLQSLANFYTMEYEAFLLKKSRNGQKAISIFVQYLAEQETGWTTLEFQPLDGEKLSNIYLRQALAKYFKTAQSLCHKNWIYRTGGENYQDYIAHSPSRIKDIKRKERRLVKKHNVTFTLWTDEADQETYIRDYMTVYDNSWKDEEQYPNFIPDLFTLCARKKILRLGILYVDDVPTAAQFNIFQDDVTLIYKLSYQEKYQNLSAGAILSFKMMAHAFDEDKSAVIDYGCGDDDYKKEWMNLCRTKETLSVYNNNLAGRYKFLKHAGKKRLKQLLFRPGADEI